MGKLHYVAKSMWTPHSCNNLLGSPRAKNAVVPYLPSLALWSVSMFPLSKVHYLPISPKCSCECLLSQYCACMGPVAYFCPRAHLRVSLSMFIILANVLLLCLHAGPCSSEASSDLWPSLSRTPLSTYFHIWKSTTF